MFGRLQDWVQDFLGLRDIRAIQETTVDVLEEQTQKLEQIQEQVSGAYLAIADLREKLDLDPMVNLKRELADFQTSGDPQLGG